MALAFLLGSPLSGQSKAPLEGGMVYGSLWSDFTFASDQMVNANAKFTGGTGLYFAPNQVAMVDLSIDLAPLTQTYETTLRAGQLLLPRSANSKLGVLAELHYGLFLGQYHSIIGYTRHEVAFRAGLGVQVAYDLGPRTSLYIWPQFNRTNAEVFGLSLWNVQVPIGLQYHFNPQR